MNYIRSVEWLAACMDQPDVVIVDCRFHLMDPQAGEEAYKAGHIPNAFYADLERHLSGPEQTHGGRHPLPDVKQLQAVLESFGITERSTVVAYDQGEAMFAGRFWWLLSYIGHEKVYVLDGGFKAWKEQGLPVTQEIPPPALGQLAINLQTDWLATLEEVKEAALHGAPATLIDSRAAERYKGEVEPLDRVPGHIPSAQNYFFLDSLKEGYWKSPQQQMERFRKLDRTKPVIVYCGSGVSATPNIIALKAAGFRDVKLYAGSYSDWSSYQELPVAKGESE
ncbi:sulfurtransferase [Bacillus xiapuensis]|uniref:sulfurtransferase n=1 Tax=Bacillus xiapuensis TaxID=2014075 RepID=UPI000C243EE9|nr:sulfurtransferase [Bacillus xiapuensis]